MKIVVTDIQGDEFSLLKTRNTDDFRHASRIGTRNAFLNYLKGENNLVMTDRNDRTESNPYEVGVEFLRGILSIGCHTFNRAASNTIIDWLGIPSRQIVAARKIGRKMNRRA